MSARRAAFACLLLSMAGAAQAVIRSSLDYTAVTTGDTVQLTLERDGQSGDQPDLSPLQQDFEVLRTNRSSSIQVINGSMSSRTQTIVTLAPKRVGKLTIPAIEWAGDMSAPLTLTVTPAGAGAGKSNPGAAPTHKVFLETNVDQSDPFVQQAVQVTVRIYRGETVYKAGLDFPASNDALVEQIQSDEHRTVEKNGQEYDLVERHYLVFPQKSGQLSLPGPVLEGQVAMQPRNDPFGNDPFANLFGSGAVTKPIRVQADPIVLNVRPRPPNSGSGPWLPARDVTLSGEWHPESGKARVGDPVTLDLHLQAQGLTATQLPDLSTLLELPPGLKAYPDQAKLDNAVHGDTVTGSHNQSVALIADQPGDYLVPALKVSWWDTSANEMRDVSLPSRTLHILPAAGGASVASTFASNAPAPGAAPGGETGAAHPAPMTREDWRSALRDQPALPWMGISAALTVVWLSTLLAWWMSRRRPRATAAASSARLPPRLADSPGQARAQFLSACARNDAPGARRALLAWVAAAWPDEPPPGLVALAKRIGNEAITARLLDLDRAVYAGAPWDGAALAHVLQQLPPQTTRSPGGGDGLAPLYP